MPSLKPLAAAALLAFAGAASAQVTLTLTSWVPPAHLLTRALSDWCGEVSKATDAEGAAGWAETLKGAFADIPDAVEATAAGGAMDGGVVAWIAPESATLVAGGLVLDTAKLESGLRKLGDAAAKDPKLGVAQVEWESGSHGGVTLHTLRAPVKDDKAQQLLGSQLDVVVAIGPQAAYVSVGRDALASLQRVIDGSAAQQGVPASPFSFQLSLGKLFAAAQSMADDDKKPMFEMLANVLASDGTGQDHVRAHVEGIPNGLRTRIELEPGVLQAIGAAGMMSQMSAAGAP
ncbi:MAG TPA: hypothetical protein PJ982_14360 [Lacipirellulaceae bacterium]|nr:hypothetical protein [Lacipirellulaceae bacterium]